MGWCFQNFKRLRSFPAFRYATASVAFLPAWPGFYDHWWTGWFVFALFGCFFFAYLINQKYGLAPAIVGAWTLFSGIRIVCTKDTYSMFDGPNILGIENIIFHSIMATLFLGLVFLAMNKKSLIVLEESFATICLCNTILVLYQFMIGVKTGGLLGNPSINGTFLAISYPLLAMKPEQNPYNRLSLFKGFRYHALRIIWDALIMLTPIIAVFLSDSSIPIGVLAVVIGSYIFLTQNEIDGLNSISQKAGIVIGLVGAMVVVGLWKVPQFFYDNGRFENWRIGLTWWRENSNIWLGAGPGSYFMLGPMIQSETKTAINAWWIWCHNDYVQVLFEQGVIGLAASLWLFFDTLIRFYRRQDAYLTVCLLGFAAGSFFNFPAHLAQTATFGCLILARLRLKEE